MTFGIDLGKRGGLTILYLARLSLPSQLLLPTKRSCNDYAVIYATQQAFLCSGYWAAVARELESRREKMLNTWR